MKKIIGAIAICITAYLIYQFVQTSPDKMPLFPKTLEKIASGQSVTIVTYGDSITKGKTNDNYPSMLKQELRNIFPNSEIKIINSGMSGATSFEAKEHIQQKVLSLTPDAVIVEFGWNDLAKRYPIEDFISNMTYTIEQLQPHTELALITTTRVNIGLANYAIRSYNKEIKNIAKKYKIPVIDIYGAWGKAIKDGNSLKSLLNEDNIHPNIKGHKIISDTIIKRLKQ